MKPETSFLSARCLPLAAAVLLSAVPSVGLSLGLEIADGSLVPSLSGTLGYDSNTFANANEEGDAYATLTPALEFARGKGLIVLHANAGVNIIRFNDFTNQNAEDFFGALEVSYPNRPDATLVGTFDLGWRQSSGTNEFLGTRTETNVLKVGAGLQRRVSQKLSLRGSAGYQQSEARTAGLSDVDVWAVDGGAVFTYSEKLDVLGGYRYRHTETGGGQRAALDADDHLLRVGAEGQLMPKIVGHAAVGVQYRLFHDSDQSDSVSPYADASLAWNPSERTVVTLAGSKDFQATADDRSVDRTNASLTLAQRIYGSWSGGPFVSYTHSRIKQSAGASRTDRGYGAGGGVNYDFAGGKTSGGLRYTYLNQDSTEAFFDYQQHVIELAVTARF